MARYTLLVMVTIGFIVATAALQPVEASATVFKSQAHRMQPHGESASLPTYGEVEAVEQFRNRKLLQLTWWQRMANNQRAQATTAQEIEKAVNDGASMQSVTRAARVGDAMTWAAAQDDQHVFDVMERVVRTYP